MAPAEPATAPQAPTLELPIEWMPADGRPEQLIVLWHGWRSDAQALLPLASALRNTFPQAAVLVPESPIAFRREGVDTTARGEAREGPELAEVLTRAERPVASADLGRMWYSIAGLAEDTTGTEWPRRVHACVPVLAAWLRAQQQRLGVSAAATALGGFSQGAILALAAVQREDGLAGRVLAFGGCYTAPPTQAPQRTTLHFFHGSADAVIPAERARQALRWLGALQGDATLDIAEGVGHELHPSLIDCALHRLTHHIPMRTWREALGAVPHDSVGSAAGGAGAVPTA